MRRKLLIGAISLLAVILILVVGVFWYIRSGRLDLLVQRQVIAGLADLGIRAEIGSTRLDIRGYKVTLTDLKLYADESDKPFAKVNELITEFSVVDYLKQKINLTQIKVVQPDVWIEIDEAGRTNIDNLHAPPESKEKESAIRFLTAFIEVTKGKLNVVDKKNKVSAEVPDFFAKFTPNEPAALEDKINHKLELGFNSVANATYDGRRIDNINASLLANVTDSGAEILVEGGKPRFEIASDLGRVTAGGRIENYTPLKYSLDVNTDITLNQVARVFMPDTQIDGSVTFTGQVTGTAGDYHAEGSIQSNSVAAEGFRVAGIRVQTKVDGSGTQYNASADVTSGPVTGRGITISSIRFSDARVEGKDADFDVTGGLALASLKSGRITVNNLRGRLQADPDRVSLTGLTASALGGSVSGSASVAYGGGQSKVDVEFRSIDLNQASTLASAKDVRVRGSANGSASLTFPALEYKAATGRINATFDAAVSPADSDTETAPADGQIGLVATGRGFRVERAYVRSRASEVTATGTVSWDGGGDLNVNFKSDDMAEVQRVIDAFGFIPDEVKEQYAIAVAGTGQFTGRVQGRLAAPTVTGHLSLSEIRAKEETVGSFEGDIAYSPSLVRVEQAALVRPDGSRADFSVSAPLVGDNNIAVRANVQNFDLPAIVRAASPSFADFIGRGTVNGTIDLRGLPGPRTIEGTANLTLSAGEFNIPAAEEGKDSKTISVPEFTGNIQIANSVLSVENLRLQLGDSSIAGQGTFNLDTYAYSINAEGRNIDLAQVADAVSEGAIGQSVQLSGRADLNITGRGEWEDWTNVNLNATIQGQNVIFNGRELGNAKLAAFTENGLLKVEATGNVLDQDRTLTATIDLRDRNRLPVSANIEFTDTDIGPYLGLVAPELGGISGRATGSIRLGGNLLDEKRAFSADQIQVVARLSMLEVGGKIAGGQQYTIRNQGDIVVTASAREVKIERVTFTGEGTSVSLEGIISREGGARSNLAVTGEVNLRFLSSFTETVFTTGIAQVQASIVGSLEAPQLLGTVNLRDVGVRVVDFPLSVARGNGIIRFTADQASIENFTASTPGGGSIRIVGGAALSGLVPDRWRIETSLDQVGLEYPQDTQTVVDAQLALQGNRRIQVLTGNVEVRRAAFTRDITLEELISGGGPFGEEFFEAGPGGGGGAGAGPPITVDIRINADNTLVVRNNLADAVGSAYLNLRGSVVDPVISGRIQLSRGTLEFRNDRYEITRAIITLPPRRRAEPVLDVQSEADVSGYRLTIGFSGTPSKLETTLRSDPELPEADIVSLILTGNVAGDRSTAAAATQTGLGLAQSLLAAGLNEQLGRGAQRLFGLSRFSVDPLIVGRGSDPTARVTIGQQITKNLTITYSQNLTSGGSSGLDRIVLIEYRLTNRFSVVGFRNDRGELGFDVRVRKRF